MELKRHLQKIPKRKVIKLAKEHNIYYQDGFSRSWLIDQIKRKLTEQNHLKKLINKGLNGAERKIIQKLIKTNSINKNSIHTFNYQRLLNYSLIYERNNFCYLFSELKPLLEDIFNLSQEEQNTYQTKKFSVDSNLEKNRQNYLSFFHYLILTLAQIKQLSSAKQRDSMRKNGFLFLKKINLSPLKSKKLYEQILKYSLNHDLIAQELKLKDKFQNWLQTPYQKKVLSVLDSLLPNLASGLRNIIAVLSYYPKEEKIPLDFAYQELKVEKIKPEQEKILTLLNLFTITDRQISLKNEAWQHFNPRAKFHFKKVKTEEKNIIVPPHIQLNKLWKIASTHNLTAIQKELIFTKDQITK